MSKLASAKGKASASATRNCTGSSSDVVTFESLLAEQHLQGALALRGGELLLALLYNAGARVSEVIGVKVADVVLDPAARVHLHGKGRKQRSLPLWRSTVKVIRAWLRVNPDLGPASALLPNRGGQAMT